MKTLIVVFRILAVISGVILLLTLLDRHYNYFPESLTVGKKQYIINKKSHDEVVDYEVTEETDLKLLIKLSGSTDLLCDPPLLLKYDVDGDGYKDLYFASCGGHQFYRLEGANSPELVDLGQYEGGPDSLDSWCFHELKEGFRIELLISTIVFVFSCCSFIILRFIKRKSISSR